MALKSLIHAEKGAVYLNSLKRYVLSGVVTPRQNLLVAKIPAAASITQPGRSTPIPIQGPKDASTEIYSLTGKQGIVNQGIGSIVSDGTTAIVGIGTKFLTQIQLYDTISNSVATGVVVSIQSDTALTVSAGFTTSLGDALPYVYSTTIGRPFGENIFVSISDQAWRRRLMNRDVPAMHVFGSNRKPLFTKESTLLEGDQTLVFDFLNYNTAGPASFALIAEGRKWQIEALKNPKVNQFVEGLRNRKQFSQPYWLTLDKGWSALSTGGSSNEFMTCTGDITLVLFNLYGQAFKDADGTDVSNSVTVQFVDAKTQRAIQCQPMPLSCIAGTAENPMRLPTPWIIEPQTQIRMTLQNNSGTACKAYVTLHGVAIYTGSSWHGSTLTNKQLMREGQKMYRAMSEPQVRPAEPQG